MARAVITTPVLRALDHRFDVATHDAALIDHLRDLFAALPTDPARSATRQPLRHYALLADGSGTWALTCDDVPIVAAAPAAHALATLLWRVNIGAIEDTTDLVLLHAGGVALGDVRVLMPGDTDVGKSTLVSGLLQAGAGYLGDEVIGLHLDVDEVVGYPKPVSLDPGAWPLFPELAPDLDPRLTDFVGRQWHVPPHAFGDVEVVHGGLAGLVAFPQHTPGAEVQVEPVHGAAALGLLAGCAFDTAVPHPQRLERLARLVERTPCVRLTYGRLDAAVEALHDLAAEVAAPLAAASPDATPLPTSAPVAPQGDAEPVVAVGPDRPLEPDQRLQARSAARLVRVGAEAVAYVHARGPLHGLNATGLLVWERLDGQRALAEVVDELAAHYGRAREEVADDVVGFAARLLANGLLEPAGAATD